MALILKLIYSITNVFCRNFNETFSNHFDVNVALELEEEAECFFSLNLRCQFHQHIYAQVLHS